MNDFKTTLEERKAKSTLQVLFKVARLLNAQAIERSNQEQRWGQKLRPSHMAIFPHLSLKGSRITSLAEEMQISKQAVAQLVEDLEQLKIVRRVPDPTDGRAKLVQFTKSGRTGMLRGLDLLTTMEQELADIVGVRRMADLRTTLSRILEHVAPQHEKRFLKK